MKKSVKRVFSIILVVLLLTTAFAGCAKDNGTTDGTTDGTTKGTTNSTTNGTTTDEPESNIVFPLEEAVTIELTTAESPSQGQYDFENTFFNSLGGKWFKDTFNIDLKVTQIPYASYQEKLQLMFATGSVSDIIFTEGANLTALDANIAGEQGQFVDFMAYKDLIPNLLNYINDPELPSMKYAVTEGGQMYYYPQINESFVQGTGYLNLRWDVFKENNLKYGTWDELYESMLKIKELYPDSYPFAGIKVGDYSTLMEYMPVFFNSSKSVFFDTRETHEWLFGPVTNNYKDMLIYMNKLYKADLIFVDSYTSNDWTLCYSKLLSDVIFITVEGGCAGGAHDTNNPAKNPNVGTKDGGGYWLDTVVLPTTPSGKPGLGSWDLTEELSASTSNFFLVSSKSDYVEECIAMLDYIATKEGMISLMYGGKGTDWDFADGRYSFLTTDIIGYGGEKTPQEYLSQKYGYTKNNNQFSSPLTPFNLINTLIQLYREDVTYSYLAEMKGFEAAYKANGNFPSEAQPYLAFSTEDAENVTMWKTALMTYTDEMQIKFITGEESFDNWDAYVAKCESMGASKILESYKANMRN
jgi:putative aldouronate transport system substrate-binding protein